MKKCNYCNKWKKQKEILKVEKAKFGKITKRGKLIISMRFCGHCRKKLEMQKGVK